MKANNCFYAFLKDALWRNVDDLPSSLSEKDADIILELAEKQALSGLIIDSLFRHNVSLCQQTIFEAIGLLEQIKQNNHIVNKGVVSLKNLFNTNNIQYVVVKGQAVGSYYPDPLLRQAGDVDYYCDANNYAKSHDAVASSWGVIADEDVTGFHEHYDYAGVTYEGHYSLTTLCERQKNEYWGKILKEDSGDIVCIDGTTISTLSPLLHTLFIFLHLYRHLMSVGVGLRQFCDWAMILHRCSERINQAQLQYHLKKLGMEKAYRACGSIMVDYLGLSESEFGYHLTENDRKYGRKIMDVVLYRGNMGHYNKRNGFSGWKHKVEAPCIKISPFAQFMPLAPSYSCHWLANQFVKKVL